MNKRKLLVWMLIWLLLLAMVHFINYWALKEGNLSGILLPFVFLPLAWGMAGGYWGIIIGEVITASIFLLIFIGLYNYIKNKEYKKLKNFID